MKRRMYMFDFARLRSFHSEEFSTLVTLLEKLGYNELGLYVEGAFLPDNECGAIRESVITQQIADEILSVTSLHNITVFPMTNVLYHMEHYLCQERYAYLRRKGPNARYLINFEHEDAIPFALKIIRSLAKMFHTKKIQIGLDEFPFAKEEIPMIGQYISAVTMAMLSEGYIPAVWGDIFWMEPSLTKYLPRETEIHDWNYYGHRPESIRYFRESGFDHVIVVPSDNGWEGFTGCQRVTGHCHSRTDLPVEPGEVEAFLEDGIQEGAEGGMIACWQNTIGRSLWSAMVPVARAGLWMQGKWEKDRPDEEQTEIALFDRITPYSCIVKELQKLQMHVSEKCHIRLPQDALYRPECMLRLLNQEIGFWDDTIALYEQTLPIMEEALNEWKTASACEEYARTALHSVVVNVRAAYLLMRVSQAQTIYRKAAMAQYQDHEAYLSLLEQFCSCVSEAQFGLQQSINARKDSIRDTGITHQDFIWQERLMDHLQRILLRVKGYIDDPNGIEALCTYTELIYCWEFEEGGYVPQ